MQKTINAINIKFKGFTLIELLFVIAIISVIAAAGMSIVKQRAQEAKVEKCALQMQQLLQAGMAYYVDNNCWPDSGKCSQPQPPPFQDYIPIGEMDKSGKNPLNPWGEIFKWKVGTSGNLFQISTLAPNGSIAERVKGMLPNAEVDPGTALIKAETTIPGQVTGGVGEIYVAKVGTTEGGPISDFSCSPGYVSKIYFSPYSLSRGPAMEDGYGYFFRKLPDIKAVKEGGGCSGGEEKPCKYTVTIDRKNTGEKCNMWVPWFYGTSVKFKCDFSFGNNNDYYGSYKTNYAIYCCKMDPQKPGTSKYCEGSADL